MKLWYVDTNVGTCYEVSVSPVQKSKPPMFILLGTGRPCAATLGVHLFKKRDDAYFNLASLLLKDLEQTQQKLQRCVSEMI